MKSVFYLNFEAKSSRKYQNAKKKKNVCHAVIKAAEAVSDVEREASILSK